MGAVKRRAGTPAQVGGGDPRVVAHPSFREIPPCRMHLQSDEAKREYDTIARLLFDAGRLSLEAQIRLSLYARMFDNITIATAEGRPLAASWFTQMQSALGALRLDDLDQPIAAPETARANKYARTGFACRRR